MLICVAVAAVMLTLQRLPELYQRLRRFHLPTHQEVSAIVDRYREAIQILDKKGSSIALLQLGGSAILDVMVLVGGVLSCGELLYALYGVGSVLLVALDGIPPGPARTAVLIMKWAAGAASLVVVPAALFLGLIFLPGVVLVGSGIGIVRSFLDFSKWKNRILLAIYIPFFVGVMWQCIQSGKFYFQMMC